MWADKVSSGSLREAFNGEMQVLDPGSESSRELTRKWQKDQTKEQVTDGVEALTCPAGRATF